MGTMMSGAPDDFPSLKPGGHVCLPYAEDEERHSAIAGFFRDGLVRGERCIYWGPPASFAALLPYLQARGLPVSDLCERETLLFADTTRPSSHGFDLAHQLASIREAIAAAHSDGYAGLRVAGDPDPETRASLSHEQLAAFEASLSRLLGDGHASGLCAFDRRATDASSLEVALATHEIALVAGRLCHNPYFNAPTSVSDGLAANDHVAWMAANILEASNDRELLEAENAALVMHGARASKCEAAHRRTIATLLRSIEARDRLLITAARWLSRPLPAMCSHLQEFTRTGDVSQLHQDLATCSDHLAAVTRLSHGLDEIASFLQLQVVLRPERLDMVEVTRAAISEIKEDTALAGLEISLDGAESVTGAWDRLRITRLFHSLIRTARDQGYDTRVRLRIDDLGQFVRIRLEFMLPHAPSLSASTERAWSQTYGPSGESDYERLAVQTWPAREIVRMMGGTLGVSTWADARVVFTLDLPKAMPPMPRDDDLPGR
jgi:hypothetical protein